MTNALSNALSITPFMIRLYSFCDPNTQSSLTKVSNLWKQVPVIFQFKKSVEYRVRALNDVLRIKFPPSFEDSVSVEHIQVELQCYKQNVLHHASPEAARYAILPIELQNPFSIFIQAALFSLIKLKTIESLYKCNPEKPEQCIEHMSKETINKLSEGFVQEALLFFDMAQSWKCLKPLLDLTFYKLLSKLDYQNALTILVALSLHPDSKEMSREYLDNFKAILEKAHAEHPFEEQLVRDYRETICRIYKRHEAFLLPDESQNNQTLIQAVDDEEDVLCGQPLDDLHDFGIPSENPQPMDTFNQVEEENSQLCNSLSPQNDTGNFSDNLTPLEAFNQELNQAGVDFEGDTYLYLRDKALSIQPYLDSIKALEALLEALNRREYTYWPWVDEIEGHLGLNIDEDDYLIPGEDDFVDDDDSVIADTLESVEHLEISSEGPQEILSMLQLMNLKPDEWKQRSFSAINARIKHFCSLFSLPGRPADHYALLEKQDLNSGDTLAVVGDLHGNGLRFDLTLKALQNLGFLDAQFHLEAGKYIVFLGDYMDRGENNLKVLELLIALKIENPKQVFLVRGNHEDISQNSREFYTPKHIDPLYRQYMANANNTAVLSEFYNNLPDTVYLGQKDEQTNEYQYAQYCHGLFHMYTDPLTLLTDRQPHTLSWVTFSDSFGSRIQKIPTAPIPTTDRPLAKKIEAFNKLKHLSTLIIPKLQNLHWFDIGDEIGNLGTGRETIPPLYPKAYLQLHSTQDIKIKEIFRGHQKGDLWRSGLTQNKAFITTLDPSINPHQQKFMIMQVAPKIKDYHRSCVVIPLIQNQTEAIIQIKVDSII